MIEATDVNACGFEQVPLTIDVDGSRFEVFIDARGEQKRFSGSKEGEEIEFWSNDWFQIDVENGELEKAVLKFSGKFSQSFFSGDFHTISERPYANHFATTVAFCFGKVAAYRLQSQVASAPRAFPSSDPATESDSVAPEIIVGEDFETDRSTIELSGKVKDDSPIFELNINGRPVPISSDGTFHAVRPVPVGRSELIVVATDEWGNRAEKRISVFRKLHLQSSHGNTVTPQVPNRPNIDFGRFRALVIGNNEYAHIKQLQTAESDAFAVAEALRSIYGFEVDILLNATRYDIFKGLA